MEGARAAARGRAPRSISAAVRSNRVVQIPTVGRHSVTSAVDTKVETASREDDKPVEDVVALQCLLQEQVAQVERLEALLSEKQLIKRYDEAHESRMRQYDEQLGMLAALVKGDSTKTAAKKKKSDDKLEKGAGPKCAVSVQEIMDGVQELWYKKKHMEGELAKRERALEVARAELKEAQACARAGELSLRESKPTSSQAAPPMVERDAVSALEQKLAEMEKKYNRTEEKLTSYQAEYRVMRQTLRDREKELLELQRKHREAVSASSKNQQLSVQWKGASKYVSTRHRRFFRGAEWVRLLQNKPDAMRCAFLTDASLELCAPHGFISIVEMHQGPDVVAVEVDVRRPAGLREEVVGVQLMECPFVAMTQLLQRLDAPKEGWDLVQEELHNSQRALAAKEEELAALQKQLRRMESSLDRQNDHHEADRRIVNEALDETEETVKVMYGEIERQRAKEKELHVQLQQLTGTLAERDKTVAELTARLQEIAAEAKRQEEQAAANLNEARRRASAELRDAETKRRQEVAAVRQQQQQLLRKAVEAPPIVTRSLSIKWSDHGELGAMPHDATSNDILRALLLGEVAAAAKAVPVNVLSLTFKGQELQAEVQLQLSSSPVGSTRVTESEERVTAPTTALFLQEWRDMKGLVESRNREIQRLAQELKTAGEEVEGLRAVNTRVAANTEAQLRELEAQLHGERERAQAMAVSQAALTEELSRVGDALVTEDATLSLAERAGRLTAKVAATEKSLVTVDRQYRCERARAHTLETRLREEESGKQHLAEMLQQAKQDLERATEALEALDGEQRRLAQDAAAAAANHETLRVQAARVTELQAARRHGGQRRRLSGEAAATDTRAQTAGKEEENNDVITALRCAYEEYDEVCDRHESNARQWRMAEKAFREKLREHEADCEQLRSQLATLQKELQERELASAAAETSHQRSEAERDGLLNHIRQETQLLSKRLAKNDALQRETEAAKKALEGRVVELMQRCEACEAGRKQLQEVAARLEKDRVGLQNTVTELQTEMNRRNQRADELVKQLVQEEDARRALEGEVMKLRRSKTASSAASGTASASEVQRLRQFCTQTLSVPLTEKEQTVGDIIAFVEQHLGNAAEKGQKRGNAAEKEQLAAALLSMSTAAQLLKQCVSATEEQVQSPIRRTRASAGAGSALRSFGRSLSYSSGIAPPSLSARVPRPITRKTATPSPLTRTASAYPQPRQLEQQQGMLNAKPPVLASSAAEVVYFAQLLASVVAHWRENERNNTVRLDELSKKCRDLSEELGRANDALVEKQQPGKNTKAAAQEDEGEDFLRHSRAHALSVALSVKDHLHDARAALQPVLDAIHESTGAARDSFAVDPTHDLHMAEECILYALKRIVQSAGAVFSSRERREIEAKRGGDYFTMPVSWCAGASPLRRPHSPQPRSPQNQKQQQHTGGGALVPRDVNLSSSPSASREKMREASLDAAGGADYRRHRNREDQEVIQQALREARRRNR
ncbi:hypothetical protein DQ04_04051050 [Trypanosoma grayi]|uniref:hypothetical protein n=1 Tax=Trypanosoma grayi TaxID=71804 RepID=UPI0004F4B1C2|nr:hypothetical protein DQ04_04051050 [Trypanosoma grayi]KEG10206.1 hypothetical protein DQ04_04051050 [Trypanosoma grayi]